MMIILSTPTHLSSLLESPPPLGVFLLGGGGGDDHPSPSPTHLKPSLLPHLKPPTISASIKPPFTKANGRAAVRALNVEARELRHRGGLRPDRYVAVSVRNGPRLLALNGIQDARRNACLHAN